MPRPQFTLRALLVVTAIVAVYGWAFRFTAFSMLGITVTICFLLIFFSPPSFYGD